MESEAFCRCKAYRTFFRSIFALVNVSANVAHKLLCSGGFCSFSYFLLFRSIFFADLLKILCSVLADGADITLGKDVAFVYVITNGATPSAF